MATHLIDTYDDPNFWSEVSIEERYRGLLQGWRREQECGPERYWSGPAKRENLRQQERKRRKNR